MNRAVYALALGLAAALGLNAPPAQAAVTDEQVQQLIERIEAQDRRIAELEKAAAQKPAEPAPAPAVAAVPAAAPVAPAPAGWAEKISLQGDLRYRYENIDQETATDERNRQRLRARAGIVAKPQDNLEVGFGLSTSQDGDPISSNQTLGNGGSRKDIYLDLAYFNWKALPGLAVTGGKFKNFLYRPGKHALLWDSDWNPEGFGVTYANGPVFGSVIGTWLESDSSNTEEFTYGAQFGVAVPVNEDVKLTAGVGYFNFNTAGKGTFYGADTAFADNSFDPVTNEYLYDYQELELFADLGFKLAGLPLSIFADYVNNSDADDFDTGWAAGLLAGAAKAKGTWEASYAYQDLEADAVFGALTDSDFGGGGTDNSGHVLRGAYALSDKWNLAFSYFINTIDENTGTEQDYDRLQLDMNFKY
ncbi:MAG: putative porin [Gammaproteobacteria bacterium]|nr:putative porin [Gammaproteobacteria bacterium]